MKYGHGHRWLVVEIRIGRIVDGAKLDAPDVTHAYELAFLGALDQHVPELRGVGEAAEELDTDLVGALSGRRWTIQHAAGDLHILTTKRLHHLAGGEAQRGNPIRIEPDPHRVFARAEQPEIADAIEPGQPVADVEQRVVREIQLIARAVGRVDVHHHQDVRRVLVRDDADPPHLLGQSRQRDVDAILDQDLRGIEVGAERERHGNRRAAVGGRLRGEIEHPLNAVDFLLERSGNGGGSGLRVRAWIRRRDRDARRSNLGILRDGKSKVGDGADEHDHYRDHTRENRPIDEQPGETHGRHYLNFRPEARCGRRSE